MRYDIGLAIVTWTICSGFAAGLTLKWNRERAAWFSLSVVVSPLTSGAALLLAGQGRKGTRESPRVEVQVKGKGTLAREGEELQLDVIATNVSSRGAYCLTDFPPDTGDKIKVHLHWSGGDSQSELVLTSVGTVLRVDRRPEGNHGFAVRFDVPLLSL